MTRSSLHPTRRPVRPSAAVYRRRRAVVLLLLLLVVAGVVWGVTTVLGNRDAAADAPAGPAAAESTETQPPPPSPGHVAVCAAEDVTAQVAVKPSGAGVSVEVSMRNTGEVPCLVDVASGALVTEIESGSDAVWSSAHCAGDAAEELLLDTGATTPVTVSWDGHRSAPGCPDGQPQAGPGTYRLAVALDGAPLGETEVFSLG
ncbi:hypothetical protein M3148_04315 [Georgenia satyanarayanai]|uniref:hypothetical protein n=1 Tax=Georgenia satyanarayanai TaxID=860221 RepID=UPI00203C8DEE|nr:hypothetical protein [Georgenia satyanarayanai]MCM3660222.1 hypothetical protein [Georgenia satyanarayanai]